MIETIKNECSEFLKISEGLPLLKNLNVKENKIRKEKVRLKKNKNNDLNTILNQVYKNHYNLIQRSIFAHGVHGFNPIVENSKEPCYIFPINGFKFMYTPYIQDTIDEYKNTLSSIPENIEIDLFKDILENYKHDNLINALNGNNEIIVYNIPYYYAVSISIIKDYKKCFY